MKNIAVFSVVFLLFYSGRIEAPDPDPENPEKSENLESPSNAEEKTVPIIRIRIKPPKNLPSNLINLETSLQIEGDIEQVNPTKKEKQWIDRFVTTMENWLGVITEVSKFESFQNGYKDVLKYVWDICTPSNENTPIYVRYRKDVEKTHPEAGEIYAYNFIPYWICASGFALGAVNVQLLDVYFQRSKTPKMTTKGEMVLRKDRFYDLKAEITAPWVYIKVNHEIIQWGEKAELEYESKKQGKMRVRLNDVKITLSIQLQEIDKRFVKPDSKTGLTYYFCLPKLKDLSLSVDNIQRYNNQIQKILGNGLNKDRAEKIIVDLTDLFETPEGRKEIIERVKPAIINKSAEAIMTSPDILSVAKNLCLAWNEEEPKMPIVDWKENEILLWHQAFYTGYNPIDMGKKALNLMIVHMQNIRQGKFDPPNLLGDKPPEHYDLGGLDVHDNGFDFTGTPEKKST